jgi:protein-disulfide isomerase/uncharacterized membrane protein
MFALALFGVCIAAFLSFVYLQETGIPCTDAGCDAVRQWHDAHFVKGLLPLIGTVYFLALGALTFLTGYSDPKRGRALSTALMGLGAVGVLFVAALTYVEAFRIHAFCFWCVLIALGTVAFFFYAWAEWKAWQKTPPRYEIDSYGFVKWGIAPLAIVFVLAQGMEVHSVTESEPATSGTTTAGVPTNGDPTQIGVPPEVARDHLIRPGSHSKGPANAPVTLVEFADPGCPTCAKQAPIVDQILKKYPTQVKLIYRHFPLRSHAHSRKATQAMEIAGDYGKFWQMHDILFKNYEQEAEEDLPKYAKQIGLDPVQFKKAMDAGKHADTVQQDRSDGEAMKVTSTPTFFVNGKIRLGSSSFATLDAAIQGELNSAKK